MKLRTDRFKLEIAGRENKSSSTFIELTLNGSFAPEGSPKEKGEGRVLRTMNKKQAEEDPKSEQEAAASHGGIRAKAY